MRRFIVEACKGCAQKTPDLDACRVYVNGWYDFYFHLPIDFQEKEVKMREHLKMNEDCALIQHLKQYNDWR